MVTRSWMWDELARRKALYRELWGGRPLERAPLDIRVCPPTAHSIRSQFLDGDAQLEVNLGNAAATWELGENTDAIPALRPDVGCSCLASAFGATYYWGESDSQTPGIQNYPIRDLAAQIDGIDPPDPHQDGWIPEGLRRIRRFAEAGEGLLPVSLLDAAGGMNVAADLLGMEQTLLSIYTAPEELHRLLAMVQDLFVATIRAGVSAAGGVDAITTTDFPDFWFPEGRKGHVSDDISAGFGPAVYREFSAPYHAMVYREFGCGGLHNCGPNPCHEEYVAHPLSPRSIDLSDPFSHADLPAMKTSFKGKAFIYLSFDPLKDPDLEPVGWYREVMELMSPDVLVVPVVSVETVEEGRDLFARMKSFATEYARRMSWGWT